MSKRETNQSVTDYVLERTLLRPRDAIQFLNACLEQAVGDPVVTVQMVHQAEAVYSQQRRTALADEWSDHFPHLIALAGLLKGRSPHFCLREITRDQLDSLCLVVLDADARKQYGRDVDLLQRYFDGQIGESDVRAVLAQWFYTVGLVGLKLGPTLEPMWSSAGGPPYVNSAEVNDDIAIYVHKAFWRVLGIREHMPTG